MLHSCVQTKKLEVWRKKFESWQGSLLPFWNLICRKKKGKLDSSSIQNFLFGHLKKRDWNSNNNMKSLWSGTRQHHFGERQHTESHGNFFFFCFFISSNFFLFSCLVFKRLFVSLAIMYYILAFSVKVLYFSISMFVLTYPPISAHLCCLFWYLPFWGVIGFCSKN